MGQTQLLSHHSFDLAFFAAGAEGPSSVPRIRPLCAEEIEDLFRSLMVELDGALGRGSTIDFIRKARQTCQGLPKRRGRPPGSSRKREEPTADDIDMETAQRVEALQKDIIGLVDELSSRFSTDHADRLFRRLESEFPEIPEPRGRPFGSSRYKYDPPAVIYRAMRQKLPDDARYTLARQVARHYAGREFGPEEALTRRLVEQENRERESPLSFIRIGVWRHVLAHIFPETPEPTPLSDNSAKSTS